MRNTPPAQRAPQNGKLNLGALSRAVAGRLAASRSLRAASALAGVSPTTLWRLSRGQVNDPSAVMLEKVCAWMGVHPGVFFGRGDRADKTKGSGQ